MSPAEARTLRDLIALYTAGVIRARNAYRTSEHGERMCRHCLHWTKTTRHTCDTCRSCSKRKATE